MMIGHGLWQEDGAKHQSCVSIDVYFGAQLLNDFLLLVIGPDWRSSDSHQWTAGRRSLAQGNAQYDPI
jgi:hypothetical protein